MNIETSILVFIVWSFTLLSVFAGYALGRNSIERPVISQPIAKDPGKVPAFEEDPYDEALHPEDYQNGKRIKTIEEEG